MMLSFINEPEREHVTCSHTLWWNVSNIGHQVKAGRQLPIEDVVDLFPDVRSQAQELAIDAMEGRL